MIFKSTIIINIISMFQIDVYILIYEWEKELGHKFTRGNLFVATKVPKKGSKKVLTDEQQSILDLVVC